jgi:hypothetical protein
MKYLSQIKIMIVWLKISFAWHFEQWLLSSCLTCTFQKQINAQPRKVKTKNLGFRRTFCFHSKTNLESLLEYWTWIDFVAMSALRLLCRSSLGRFAPALLRPSQTGPSLTMPSSRRVSSLKKTFKIWRKMSEVKTDFKWSTGLWLIIWITI